MGNQGPNSIKKGGGDDVRLQVTIPARESGLIDDSDRAEVIAWGFDGLILVIGRWVHMGYRADLVSKAAGYTDSIHGGHKVAITPAGHGYQVNLPVAKSAGFEVGDDAPVVTADRLLIIHDGTQRQIAEDLATFRREQLRDGDD